jgi:4-amino-4-deoxy-L-arabinose transferase-like glycosyltransferase
MKRWQWVGLIALTILITRATTLFIPLIDDEETFAVIGRILLHGGLPYVDVADNKPPLLYYWYSLVWGIFGESNTTALHVIGMAWVGATCYLIFKIAQRAATPRAGYFSALNYAIFTTTFVPSYIALHATLIMALPLCLSVWALIRWHDTNRPRWMILSGMCCGLAIFFKFQALVQIAFILWAVGYLYFRRLNRMWDSLFPGLIGFIIGVGAVITAVLGFLHHHHILQEFYDVTWKASVTYMKEGESAGDFWGRFASHVGSYVAATFPLWIALGAQLFHRFSKYITGAPINRPIPTWIWGWFLFSIPAVLAGGRFYGHYFIQLLPPLCIIAGITWNAWWTRSRGTRAFIVTSLAILAVGWMVPRVWFQEFADRFNIQNIRVEQKIGDYLKTHSPEDSTLFVWGVDPSVYFFANRAPATRFLWSDGLVGRLPGVIETQTGAHDTSMYINPQNWQQFLSDFNAHPPLYIVDCASGNLRDYGKFPIQSYPAFFKIVQFHYRPETAIEGVILYRHR